MTREKISSDDVKKYLPLVKKIAFNLKKRLPPNIQTDDLIQDGYIGLLGVLQKYDPSQGEPFKTYASIRIRGTILDGLRRLSTQPRSVMKNKRKLKEATMKVEARTHREAKPEEIAEELGVSMADFFNIVIGSERNIEVSINNYLEYEECPGNVMLEHFRPPEDLLQREQVLSILKTILQTIPERERLVFELYFKKELNLREIGTVLGMSESRVGRLLAKATMRISSRFKHDYNITAA